MATNLRSLIPPTNGRMFLVGQTGSGKTYLAERIVRYYPCVLAIDPKGDLGGAKGLAGYKMISDPRQLSGRKDLLIQYRPDPKWMKPDHWDQVYWWAFRRKHTFVWTNEVYLTMDGMAAVDGMRACITSGRSRGVGMLHEAQRPSRIPTEVRSESQFFAVFALNNPVDRKTMWGHVPHEKILEKTPDKYAFYHYNEGEDDLKYLRLGKE
jgi:hypothetical protein